MGDANDALEWVALHIRTRGSSVALERRRESLLVLQAAADLYDAEPKNLHDLVRIWLKAKGYDGLVDSDTECGCGVGPDEFAPCGDLNLYGCEPAMFRPCTTECTRYGCCEWQTDMSGCYFPARRLNDV